MSTALTPPEIRTLADLLQRLGGVTPDRVRSQPPPGTATEEHLLHLLDHEDRLCELVDGVLVEDVETTSKTFPDFAGFWSGLF